MTIEFKRNKELFEKGVISSQDFNTQKLRMDQASLELENAKADFEIIKLGSAGGSATANTNVRATVSGTILAVCSCTILPLFSGIHKRGAGLGPAITFLYSGPAINILAIILTAQILGLELGPNI